MSEVVTRPHVQNFIDWSADKPEVLVLTADLTNSCEVGQWRDTYPDRYFSLGMAEQNMVGFAAGLAREGFEPWLHTFAVFLYRRPLDQLQMSVAYPNLPVRLVGFLPGLMTPGGVTHQAIDDLAVMRAIPNMTILETGDATEVETVLDVAHAIDGPVYIRMLRGEVPRLFDPADAMRFGVARDLTPEVTGPRVTLISSGICTEEALRAVPALTAAGVTVKHLHVNTIKPFDDPQVLDAIRSASDGVITMENHLRVGGLGSAVAELIAEHGLGTRLVRIGIDDTYCHGASLSYLQREYGIDATALCRAVGELCQVSVDESAVLDARQIQVHSAARAEAL
ncbi:transketolase family protein [Enemella sp. A6]|uniref:transketolase family protein n=1 Tax=Enemella sp. A6 TaxID=3440152 RepID=UPI003EBEEA0B